MATAESESLASKLSSQLALSLSLIQGVSLNHSSTSRHLPASTLSSTDTPSRTAASVTPPLSSVVIDTLLCILVDAPLALRAFEDATGTQAVVKILKRAGTPREVRMKCLEFLYFYLLDENPQPAGDSSIPLVPTSPPTAPATPLKPSKPYLNSKPLRPSSSRFASELSFPSNKTSTSASSTPRSTSSGSFSSTSSNTSSSTAPSSISSSSVKPMYPPKTPPRSPSLPHRLPHKLQPRPLMMLRKEVEYEPQSPKKPQLSRAGSGSASRNASTKSMSRLRAVTEDDYRKYNQLPGTPSRHGQSGTTLHHEMPKPQGRTEKIRTTEEKKELLGTMLGNVDALVEGVRKAGIWGLG
ncbi:hypothetical protein C0993_010818 [Termitomyces sp. T159_Od127]|nr:hypothetical protein C0993_010818 [Termitomyces sp. T159_Od127]